MQFAGMAVKLISKVNYDDLMRPDLCRVCYTPLTRDHDCNRPN